MPTDWSARTAAIEYFTKLVRQLKWDNDDDKEMYEQALNALRRSQDHTAIQTKLTATMRELNEYKKKFEHSPSIITVVDKWQDHINSRRKIDPPSCEECYSKIELILRDIRIAVEKKDG